MASILTQRKAKEETQRAQSKNSREKYNKVSTMKADISRKNFILAGTVFLLPFKTATSPFVITVNGKMPATKMQMTLVHEHFLVDFIGADKINSDRWNRDEVAKVVLPFLLEVKKYGVKTIFDCTPAFLGRDVLLQKKTLCRKRFANTNKHRLLWCSGKQIFASMGI